jgi:hypothetical protein
MSWLKRLFDMQDHDPYYIKIKTALHKMEIDKNIAEAYYLGGCVYSSENYKNILLSIANNTLFQFLNKEKFDVQKDNMELYLISYRNDEKKLIVLCDPYELYQTEEILKVISPYNHVKVQDERIKKIYP